MALGAQRRHIGSLILREMVFLTGAGLVTGLVGAVTLSQILQSRLCGVSANDPFTLAIVSTILVGATVLACYMPARRAVGVEPTVALQE